MNRKRLFVILAAGMAILMGGLGSVTPRMTSVLAQSGDPVLPPAQETLRAKP